MVSRGLIGAGKRWMARCIRHRSVEKKTGPNPTDRAKSGTKESVWTDGRGIPLGITVAGANVNDYKLLEETLESSPISRPDPRVPDVPEAAAVQALSLDADYFRVEIYEVLERWGFTAHIRPIGSKSGVADLTDAEVATAGIAARRWVVERTHS